MVEWIQNQVGISHGAITQVQQSVLQAWATGWKGILAKHNMDAWLNRTELGPTGTEYKVRKIDVRGWAPTGVLFFGSQPLLFINLIFHRPSSSYSTELSMALDYHTMYIVLLHIVAYRHCSSPLLCLHMQWGCLYSLCVVKRHCSFGVSLSPCAVGVYLLGY